jgi:hypothetical protein
LAVSTLALPARPALAGEGASNQVLVRPRSRASDPDPAGFTPQAGGLKERGSSEKRNK